MRVSKKVIPADKASLIERSQLEPIDYSDSEDDTETQKDSNAKQDLSKDYKNISLLMLLYFLQV